MLIKLYHDFLCMAVGVIFGAFKPIEINFDFLLPTADGENLTYQTIRDIVHYRSSKMKINTKTQCYYFDSNLS